MTRALSSSWRSVATLLAALFLIALTSSHALANKPTVAILGLEVVDPTGIDATSTSVARDLTEGLRSRAKAGAGPYQLAIGSDKELIDEKLIHNCDTEAIACMAEIGKNLGANYLIYGRLEKKAAGFAVTINLLNVDKRVMEKAKSPLTIAQKDPTTIAAAARKAYNDLTGTTELGTLVITANAQRGTVLLDDEPKGNLNSGTITLTGLKEGRYRLAIEADGFKRSDEIVVTIRSGETATQPVTLVEGKPDELKHEITGTTSSGGMNIWKPVFGVALVAGLGVAGVSLYSFNMWRGDKSKFDSGEWALQAGRTPVGPGDCDGGAFSQPDPIDGRGVNGAPSTNLEGTEIHKVAHLCKWRNRNIKAGWIAGAIGVVVVGTAYMAFFRGSSETQPPPPPPGTQARRVRKKPQFSVTPVVSVDGGGATFQIDW